MEKNLRSQIVKFLDGIQGPDKLIEKFQILRFERDENQKDHIFLDIHITPFFPAKSFLVKLDGYKGDDGEEFFLYCLERGSACALSMICAAKNETSAVKAQAITKVKALAIPINHMDVLMKEHRQWYYFVLETYRARFNELLEVIDQVVFHSLDQKLEFYLKRQFDSLGGNKIVVTHQQIADDLNSSREVISRLLKKLESQKRISISRNEITRLNF